MKYVILSLSLIIFLAISSCSDSIPEIMINKNYTVGKPISIVAKGLSPGNIYSISVEKHDEYGRTWNSAASFKADRSGEINVSYHKPINGSYENPDVFGLFWSMTMQELPENWEAPIPKDFAKIKFVLTLDEDTLESVETNQWIIPNGVEYEVLKNDIEAEVFRKSNNSGQHPAIIFLGGSGGGLSWARRRAAYFANEGFVTMALAYFNYGKLPKHLAQIPLEYIENALEYLISHEDTDSTKIGIMGYSKGAELALLVASQKPEIKCVVAIAPGSAVFQGFKPPKYPTISSWTKDGKDLPFVPNAYDKKFFQTFDGMYLWYRTLAQHSDHDKAAIPVEKINGDILLISGVEDKIWPATYMSEQIISRLYIAEFPFNYVHLSFPNAGHGIAEPPGTPTTRVSNSLGGSAEGNAYARKKGWDAVVNLFDRNLK